MTVATVFFSVCSSFLATTGDKGELKCKETAKSPLVSFKMQLKDIKAPHIDQPWGYEARETLQEYCKEDIKALVEKAFVAEGYKTVLFCAGKVMNTELVEFGLAWAVGPSDNFPQNSNQSTPEEQKYLKGLHGLEESARKMKTGIWSESDPIHPDVWLKVKTEIEKQAKQKPLKK